MEPADDPGFWGRTAARLQRDLEEVARHLDTCGIPRSDVSGNPLTIADRAYLAGVCAMNGWRVGTTRIHKDPPPLPPTVIHAGYDPGRPGGDQSSAALVAVSGGKVVAVQPIHPELTTISLTRDHARRLQSDRAVLGDDRTVEAAAVFLGGTGTLAMSLDEALEHLVMVWNRTKAGRPI